MARRRRFYARDRRGRFARTAGSKGTYKKKMSTRKKVAIGAAAAVAVGGAAYGGRELYRAGGRKGWELGKVQGRQEATPKQVRRQGKFTGEKVNRDYSQNPFARGYMPAGKEGRARKRPGVNAGSIARAYKRYERKAEGLGPKRAAKNTATQAFSRGINKLAKQKAAQGKARALRYNAAQTKSQLNDFVRSGATNTRRAAGRARTNARINSVLAANEIRTNARAAGSRASASRVGRATRSRVAGVKVDATIIGHNVRTARKARQYRSAVSKARKR